MTAINNVKFWTLFRPFHDGRKKAVGRVLLWRQTEIGALILDGDLQAFKDFVHVYEFELWIFRKKRFRDHFVFFSEETTGCVHQPTADFDQSRR